MYEIINITTHGAGHIKRGEPCEDYSISLAEDFYKIFVVADGHGDSNCPRSYIGSRYICRIATDGLIQFARSIKSENWESRLLDPLRQGKLVEHLVTSIIGKWKEEVVEEYENHPLTPGERAGCARYIERYDRGERIEHIYGTTMIAGLMTDEYLLLLQQGDGRCDVFDENGDVSQPIPWDDRCFSNVCTSLCDTDAIGSCRYYVMDMKKNPVAAVMAGSDGVEDSYPDMDLMHSYYRDLLIYAAENSVSELLTYLEQTLPEFSETGSRDDVSIGGFIDVERIKGLVTKFRRENSLVEVKSKLKLVEDRISSMENGKMQYLEQRCQKAEQEYQNSPNEDVEKKYKAAREELEEYKARYDGYLVQKAEIMTQIDRIFEEPDESAATDSEKTQETAAACEDLDKCAEVKTDHEELPDNSEWTEITSGDSTED